MKFAHVIKRQIDSIRINKRYDKLIAFVLMIASIYFFKKYTMQSTDELVYMISLVWYLIFIFLVLNVRMFTGTGFYVLYLLVFVQYGMLLSDYFNVHIDHRTYLAITIYNFISPAVLVYSRVLLKKGKNRERTELKTVKISDKWITILFYFSCFIIFLFFLSVGTIPLFASDAENFRVSAVGGKGFLVIIASSCFSVSILLTKIPKKMFIRMLICAALLFGTGYRGNSLSLILLVFLTYWVGKRKRFLLQMVGILLGIAMLYTVIGQIRRGGSWRAETIFLPVIWRIYVNSSNLNTIFVNYPLNQLMYGRSFFIDLAILLPGAQDSFMLQLKRIMGLTFNGGSFTPTVFGEAYVDFGFIGAIIWPMIVFLIVSILDEEFKRKIDGRMYFALSYNLTGLATSSFFSCLTMGLIPQVLVYYTIIYLSKRFKIKWAIGKR